LNTPQPQFPVEIAEKRADASEAKGAADDTADDAANADDTEVRKDDEDK
jgi:hypothetical protein